MDRTLRTEASPLLPLFRSDGQGRLLARIFLAADRPAPISEIARELGLDSGGVTREADRLERAGLIVSQRIGRQRLPAPNRESPYYEPLRMLLLRAFGPAVVIGPALRGIGGIDEALIFGSWAARYLGEAGHDPADVDVLVVGFPDRREINQAARHLSDQLMREVNITLVSPERWQKPSDGFLRQVKQGPRVPIDLALGQEATDG